MPMFRMITWDAKKLEKLRSAAEEAVRINHSGFVVDLDRNHKDVRFNTVEALDLVAQLEIDFARNPVPSFPPNREGREP